MADDNTPTGEPPALPFDEAPPSVAEYEAVPPPERIAFLLAAAFEAVRAERGALLSVGKCLQIIAEEFIATWEPTLPHRKGRSMRIRDRDGGLCRVPGCSRAAVDAHHRRFRSHGGGDEPANLVSLCSSHHLRCRTPGG